MAADRGEIDHVLDLLADVPGIGSRRFFSGWSITHHGDQVGMVLAGTVYAKVPERERDAWEARGDSEPFRYSKKGGEVLVRAYWSIPADGLDDPAALRGYLGLEA